MFVCLVRNPHIPLFSALGGMSVSEAGRPLGGLFQGCSNYTPLALIPWCRVPTGADAKCWQPLHKQSKRYVAVTALGKWYVAGTPLGSKWYVAGTSVAIASGTWLVPQWQWHLAPHSSLLREWPLNITNLSPFSSWIWGNQLAVRFLGDVKIIFCTAFLLYPTYLAKKYFLTGDYCRGMGKWSKLRMQPSSAGSRGPAYITETAFSFNTPSLGNMSVSAPQTLPSQKIPSSR